MLPGECQHADKEENHEKPQLLTCLGQGRQEALKTIEMSDKLEQKKKTWIVHAPHFLANSELTYVGFAEVLNRP